MKIKKKKQVCFKTQVRASKLESVKIGEDDGKTPNKSCELSPWKYEIHVEEEKWRKMVKG